MIANCYKKKQKNTAEVPAGDFLSIVQALIVWVLQQNQQFYAGDKNARGKNQFGRCSHLMQAERLRTSCRHERQLVHRAQQQYSLH